MRRGRWKERVRMNWHDMHDVLATISGGNKKQKDLDSRGIEPRTTPMLGVVRGSIPRESRSFCFLFPPEIVAKTSCMSCQDIMDVLATISGGNKKQKDLDSRGIEPRTTPMLREYYLPRHHACRAKI
jgi:hypothetical protein